MLHKSEQEANKLREKYIWEVFCAQVQESAHENEFKCVI